MTEGKRHAEKFRSQRYRPYSAYRDSGIEWPSRIPAHWESRRLKDHGHLVAGAGFPPNYQGKDEEALPFYKVADLSASTDGRHMGPAPNTVSSEVAGVLKAAVIPKGSVLYAKIGAALLLNRRRLTTVPCCIDNNMSAFVPRQRQLTPKWAFYWTTTVDFAALANPGAVPSLSEGDQAGIPMLVPPLAEQHAIAAFLDRETTKIDALVAKKDRLIELLQEKRTTLITRTVTRGLDPKVAMKDPGVEWLGEIPKHWGVKRLWHLTPSDRKIMYGIVLPGPNVADGVPIVKGGDVAAARLRPEALSKTTFDIEARHIRSRLRGGDLVYAIRGSIGDVEKVPEELDGANLTQDAARVSYTSATHGRWLLYTLRSRSVFSQLEAGALGATIRGINIRDLKRALIPVPPKNEQEQIASLLDSETALFDALSVKVREAIHHLKEFRTALISAAVTGRIDVREAPLPAKPRLPGQPREARNGVNGR